jgi:hypothetical protein
MVATGTERRHLLGDTTIRVSHRRTPAPKLLVSFVVALRARASKGLFSLPRQDADWTAAQRTPLPSRGYWEVTYWCGSSKVECQYGCGRDRGFGADLLSGARGGPFQSMDKRKLPQAGRLADPPQRFGRMLAEAAPIFGRKSAQMAESPGHCDFGDRGVRAAFE